MPRVAAALFGVSRAPAPQNVWGCLDLGWSDESGYWVHPAAADAAMHAAAAVKRGRGEEGGFVAAATFDYYRPHARLEGRLTLQKHMLGCQ